mmetsp:Transcript_9701/g.14616  ORF Transcript_9701/g.14616 Transcript_9701/m.14616 type:complete len:473 (-) Transcript_9701:37-1455(-)
MSSTSLTNSSLKITDPELYNIIKNEQVRQSEGLCLIASENFTSRAVCEATGSCFTNKYSEGYPGARYYGGVQYCDQLERLCCARALTAFGLDKEEWACNVQAYSGSVANLAVYTGLLEPNDRICGLDLPAGGHLSHGFTTASGRKITGASKFFQSMPYRLCEQTGLIDYDALEQSASLFRPKLLICGASAYPQDWDYARLRKIADSVGALLMCDIAHISGLVLSNLCNNPFPYSDVITTTTHKTLRGPRGALIFSRIKVSPHASDKVAKNFKPLAPSIDAAVFPALQGGPHMNAIAGICTSLLEASQNEFHEYCKQVVANAQVMCDALKQHGYTVATGGTTNHLLLWNVRDLGVSSSKLERLFEHANIYVNKNTILGDRSAFNPGGIRLGSPSMVTRGFKKKQFMETIDLLHQGVKIAQDIEAQLKKEGHKKTYRVTPAFDALVEKSHQVKALKEKVVQLTKDYPMPGHILE